MNLKEMLERRAKLVAELEAIAKGDSLTDEQRADFDKKEAEVSKLDEDITRAKKLEQRRSEAADQVPADDAAAGADAAASGGDRSQPPFANRPTAPAAPAEQRNVANEFGMFVRSYALAEVNRREGRNTVQPSAVAQGLYGERHAVVADLERAQTLSENATGGFLVTPNYMPEIIKLFGPNTIVRQNASVVPGNGSYMKGRTGASFGYVGENEQGAETGVTFGMMTMAEKDISGILPISKKLLRNASNYGIEAYCRDEMVRGASEFEDRKFLYGTGVGKEVKGYYNAILAANVFAAANKTAPTRDEVIVELNKVLKAFLSANVPMAGTNPRWFMSPLTKLYLEDLMVGDVLAFPTLQGDNPTLKGFPVDTSTQVTGPSGSGGDIFFGCHSYAMVGDSVAMSLSTSDQASYVDGNGATVNMWAQGMLGIKLDMSHDFAFRYDQAFARISAVKWGQ
ncbi:phage major capsid protein [Thalassospira lohafexi]|uniref:Phage major capsid protein n=1 Tax=Thalassospira lohafexi TaxID=744227 RepID=A0A2N3L3W3_9PROT|nr:phage major capsid protein [Thalassospira lohafexi]PKR57498.1 phage major capsid protein [Thalassospira lohafexi]